MKILSLPLIDLRKNYLKTITFDISFKSKNILISFRVLLCGPDLYASWSQFYLLPAGFNLIFVKNDLTLSPKIYFIYLETSSRFIIF